MQQNIYSTTDVKNEPVLSYREGTREREMLKKELKISRDQIKDIPMIINGKEIRTDKKIEIRPPHEINRLPGYYHKGDA